MNTAKTFSIVIPTYNSERTIHETLDSLLLLEEKKKIELVISDDASKDETVALIKEWIGLHTDDFSAIVLLENRIQRGISWNHKVAFDNVSSKHAMYIGADDLIGNAFLVSNLIKSLETKETAIAKIRVEALYLPAGTIVDMYGRIERFFRLTAKKQFAALSTYGNFLYAGPGTVLNVAVLRKIDGFDTRFRTFEDYPLFLNFLKNGFKIDLLNIKGIYWVRSKYSLSATGFGKLEKQFAGELKLLEDEYIRKNLKLLSPQSRIVYEMKRNDFFYKVCRKINRLILGFPI